MRILQILPELNVGGVETGTIDFAKYMQDRGIYNIVVSHGGSLVAELENFGIKHYSLPVHKKSLISIFKSIQPLKEIILKEKIDIVHARSRVPAWITYFATRYNDAEWVTTCHGFYNTHFFSRVMSWPKLIIVPSVIIGRHMIDAFKVTPDSIRCIPRGVDLSKFRSKADKSRGESRYTVACLGRLTPIKGHVYFLRAMAKVVRTFPYVKIWIIGDAPSNKEAYKNELRSLVKRLGLTEHLEFLGNRSDVPQLLSQTDVMVLSSIRPESFGRAIIEAQAVNVPVVATRVGGFMEIIDHEKTGLLVLPKDTDEMAQAILRLLKDRSFGRQIARAAMERLQQEFTVTKMSERTLTVYKELLHSMRILIIKISALGDVILILPSIRAIRRRFPKAIIHCLVAKEYRKILQRCPDVDELIVIHNRNDLHGASLLRVSAKLRKYKFDKVIDFQNSKRSHLLSFLIAPKESYGFDNGKWGFLLKKKIRLPDKDMDPITHQFQILTMLNISENCSKDMHLPLTKKDENDSQKLLEQEWIAPAMNLVGIHICASEKWLTKNWPIEHISRLIDMLATYNIRVVLTGSPQDKDLARHIISLAKTKPANLVGRTDILELAGIIKRCHVYITPDSAPLHLAAAVGTPMIALFGPTSSRRHLPPCRSCLVFERKLKCAPCYSPRCRIFTHVCMRDISPDDVLKGVLEFMGDKR